MHYPLLFYRSQLTVCMRRHQKLNKTLTQVRPKPGGDYTTYNARRKARQTQKISISSYKKTVPSNNYHKLQWKYQNLSFMKLLQAGRTALFCAFWALGKALFQRIFFFKGAQLTPIKLITLLAQQRITGSGSPPVSTASFLCSILLLPVQNSENGSRLSSIPRLVIQPSMSAFLYTETHEAIHGDSSPSILASYFGITITRKTHPP